MNLFCQKFSLLFRVLKWSESFDQYFCHVNYFKFSNFHQFFRFFSFRQPPPISSTTIIFVVKYTGNFSKLSESVRNYNQFSKNINFRIVSFLNMVNKINHVIKYFSLLTHRLLTQFDLIWTNFRWTDRSLNTDDQMLC